MGTRTEPTSTDRGVHEAIIVGGGQSGLATAFYLRRAGVEFVILDAADSPGGAWPRMWPSLTLFSPASASNLPGRQMPSYPGFPPASHVVDYLTDYEKRYRFDVRRPVQVREVTHPGEVFRVHTDAGDYLAHKVIAATGTWSAPFVPATPGTFSGEQWHASTYPGPDPFRGTRVAVVGAANSGAQIAAELTEVADVTWYTRHPPRWMPDDVDGRVLFTRRRGQILGQTAADGGNRGQDDDAHPSREQGDGERENHGHGGFSVDAGDEQDRENKDPLGDIVMLPPVLEARDSGRLRATPMFTSLNEVEAEHLIWCTGFRPALGPFRPLLDGRTPTVEGLYLVGYGDWTGPASATLAGVSPFARAVAQQVARRVGR